MRKVRLQAVVSSTIEKRLKEEAARREISVSALLSLAAETYLNSIAVRKIPPLPVKAAPNPELEEIKAALASLQAQVQSIPPPPMATANSPRPSALHIHSRVRG